MVAGRSDGHADQIAKIVYFPPTADAAALPLRKGTALGRKNDAAGVECGPPPPEPEPHGPLLDGDDDVISAAAAAAAALRAEASERTREREEGREQSAARAKCKTHLLRSAR